MKRPVDSNYGYYEAEDETYRPIKPTYQDDYNPQYPGSYEPEYSKPTYQVSIVFLSYFISFPWLKRRLT